MDELEISGKRYISTRRAGKEYKYHADYIGQLIRGKKLLGRKVGRSWYVELDSLTEYFGKEGNIPQAPLVAKTVVEEVAPVVAQVIVAPEPIVVEESVAQPVVVVTEEPVAKEIPVAVVAEKAQEIKIQTVEIQPAERDSIHIPVRVRRPSFDTFPRSGETTLKYVSDDAPYIPTAEVSPRAVPLTRDIEADIVDEVEETEEVFDSEELQEKKFKFIPVVGVMALGLLVLGAVFGSSIFVASHTVVEAGKAASVDYSLR